MPLRSLRIGHFVHCLAPACQPVAAFETPGDYIFGYALTRHGTNVLGCVLALLATFYLWPTREKVDYRAYISDAVRANLAYLRAALESPDRSEKDMERLRRAAGLGSNNAE